MLAQQPITASLTDEEQIIPHEVDTVPFSQCSIELDTGAGCDDTLFVLFRLLAVRTLKHGEGAAARLRFPRNTQLLKQAAFSQNKLEQNSILNLGMKGQMTETTTQQRSNTQQAPTLYYTTKSFFLSFFSISVTYHHSDTIVHQWGGRIQTGGVFPYIESSPVKNQHRSIKRLYLGMFFTVTSFPRFKSWFCSFPADIGVNHNK